MSSLIFNEKSGKRSQNLSAAVFISSPRVKSMICLVCHIRVKCLEMKSGIGFDLISAWVKVFRIIPEFRILRLDHPKNAELESL